MATANKRTAARRHKPRGTKRRRRLSTREYGLPVTRSYRTANYAYPRGAGKDRGKRPSYPINTKARARAARSYAARRNTAGTLGHVDRLIGKRYGSVRAIYTGPGAVKGGGHRRAGGAARGGRRRVGQ